MKIKHTEKKMKVKILGLVIAIVIISSVTLFSITNNVSGYSYVPIDCKIKKELGYFVTEDPFNPNSKDYTSQKSINLLSNCLMGSHPGKFQ